MGLLPPSLPEGDFCLKFTWEPGSTSGGKFHSVMEASQGVGPPGVFNSELSALTLQRLLSYSSHFPTWLLFSTVVSPCVFLLLSALEDLYSPVCLYLGGNGLPCVLSFPTDPRRVVDFSSLIRFLGC